MERTVDSIVFRRISDNDWDKINQPGSAYEGSAGQPGGGGQSYIDVPVGNVTIAQWTEFLGASSTTGAGNRGKWTVTVNSLSQENPIGLTISHRRDPSVSFTSQKIDSDRSNRVPAWHPGYSNFPNHPLAAGQNRPLVYLIKTVEGEYWAGWTNKDAPETGWQTNEDLVQFFDTDGAGLIKGDGSLFIDTSNRDWPFYIRSNAERYQTKTEEEIIESSFEEDVLKEVDGLPAEELERLIKVKARNTKIVRNLKKLYEGKCQVSGEDLTFRKTDGEFYSEAHHLVALGDGGDDDYRNIIIISPLIHRMLHYANVSEINLAEIENHQLTIHINDLDYTITWHPEHARTVEQNIEEE